VGHYKWRTEQTYRDWIWRFRDWLGCDPETADTGDIKRFLTWLAVKHKLPRAGLEWGWPSMPMLE
jgi:hypothetical protein